MKKVCRILASRIKQKKICLVQTHIFYFTKNKGEFKYFKTENKKYIDINKYAQSYIGILWEQYISVT